MFKDKEILNKLNGLETVQKNILTVLCEMKGDIERLKVLWEIPCESTEEENLYDDEEWRDVKIWGYGKYAVSNKGRYKNKERKKILNGTRHNSKNLYADLHRNGNVKSVRMDRLVYATFNNLSIESVHVVIHKDGNPLNCDLRNLEAIVDDIKEENHEL